MQVDESSNNSTNEGGGGGSSSLDDMARWILSLPPGQVAVLQQMPEFRELQRAFHGLQRREHQQLMLMDENNPMSSDNDNNSNDDAIEMVAATEDHPNNVVSFLQCTANDDLVLKILDFLETKSLSRAMQTCRRLRNLVVRNARRRTDNSIGRERQLPNALQLLRAKEQIQGTMAMDDNESSPFVRVPTLLLSRCIRVTNSGDAEYNGIYYCTGSNGNGFVFTKPRQPFQKRIVYKKRQTDNDDRSNDNDNADRDPDTEVLDVSRIIHPSDDDNTATCMGDNNDEDGKPRDDRGYYLLRCIIAKRFSNETLLWYLSKEVVVDAAAEEQQDQQQGDDAVLRAAAGGGGNVTQRYSFWARLSQLGDATPDECRYPSQTSSLLRSGAAGWQSLSTTQDVAPPTVELL